MSQRYANISANTSIGFKNSVFEGQLTKAQFARVKSGLAEITDKEKDSVIIYQLRDAKWMTKEVMGIDKNPATNLL